MSVENPVLVTDAELSLPLPDLTSVHPRTQAAYAGAHLLVRFATEPLGVLALDLPLRGRLLTEIIWSAYGPVVSDRLAEIGIAAPDRLPSSGIHLTTEELASLPWLRTRGKVLANAPKATVVICTRDRSAGLSAVLSATTSMSYPSFEVVLVDNAPRTDATRSVVCSRSWAVPVRYVVEPRPGLSWARNAGTRAASGSLIAFMDDDEIPDPHWLAEYARAFAEVPAAGVASGLILPRALDTPAERFFEDLGGHSKGRGFSQVAFDRLSHAHQHPLYPLPPFGAGGNMCFRRDVLESLGLFDEALGAGTPARGGEDTAAIADAMLAGFTVVWQPSALVRHGHYDTFEGAEDQLRGYGVGLSAFYTRMLLNDPRRAATLARLAPKAVVDLLRPGRTAVGARRETGPEGLRKAQLLGLAKGPAAYIHSRSKQRRLGRVTSC